jgi:hypothetical protein
MSNWIDRTPPTNDIPIERSWETISPHERFIWVLIGIGIIIAFLLRKTPLGFLWRWISAFFIVLAITIFADQAKKNIKAWWSKD